MNGTETGSALRALSDALAGAAETAGRSVVAIHARRRIPASGVIWRDGVVVTASHTLEREEDITVTLPDGTSVGASVAGRDAGTDLAVLRLDTDAAPAAERAAGDALRVGTLVLALGRPWDGGVTASLGVISAVGGEWRTWHGGRIDRLVRLDLTIHDGFSGGPLVGADGRVLGIDTSALRRGAAVTVPVVTVERVTEELLSRGRVRRGYLGLAMQPVRLPAALRAQGGGRTGLLVLHVEPDGPGETAGILIGDILLGLDDDSFADLRDVAAVLGPETVGTTKQARLLRAGQPFATSIAIGDRGEGEG